MAVRQPCRVLGLSMPLPSATHEMIYLSQEESEYLLDSGRMTKHILLQSHSACMGVEPTNSQDGGH